MDTSEEEKAKGKTVEVGRAAFTTETKRFTILDAPGHKSYVRAIIPHSVWTTPCLDNFAPRPADT